VKIVIDMNLGTDWIDYLVSAGHGAVHWSSVGSKDDDDAEIMRWALTNGHAVLTADLDFGILLAASKAPWPSVIQVRAANTLPSHAGAFVVEALRQAMCEIEAGALITIHGDRFRIRSLPI
jgi:predicted nuclease of predicted toxin-antitoxin system